MSEMAVVLVFLVGMVFGAAMLLRLQDRVRRIRDWRQYAGPGNPGRLIPRGSEQVAKFKERGWPVYRDAKGRVT